MNRLLESFLSLLDPGISVDFFLEQVMESRASESDKDRAIEAVMKKPDLAEAVAAIMVLSAVIRTSEATTMMELAIEPKKASDTLKGDWNEAGCHTNYSTKNMKEEGGYKVIKKTILNLSLRHNDNIS